MADIYFIGAVNSSWSTEGNWSDTDGGPSNGRIPDFMSGDVVRLTALSPNCDFDIGAFETAPESLICTGYTGTFSLSDDFILASLNGNDSYLIFSSEMTFDPGEYCVSFYSASAEPFTITSAGQSFYDLNTWNAYESTFTLSDDLTVTGYFTTGGVFNGNTIYISGSVYTLAPTSGTAEIVFNGTGTWAGGNPFDMDVTINTSGTITLHGWMYGPDGGSMGDGILTYISGTITGTWPASLIFNGNTTVISNGYDWGATPIRFYGGGTTTFQDDFTTTGKCVLAASVNIAGDGYLTVGEIRPSDALGGTMTLTNDITCNGDITTEGGWQKAYNIVLNGAGKKVYCSGGLRIYGTSTTISGTATIVLNGTGSISGGAVNAYIGSPITIDTSGTITVSGDMYYRTGTITYVSGTVVTTSSELHIQSTCGLNTYGINWNALSVSGASVITLYSDLSCASFAPSAATTLSGEYDLLCSGSLTIGGNVSGTAGIVLNGTGTWSHTSSSYSISNDVSINTSGTITLSGSNITYKTGTLTYVSGTMVTTGSDFRIGGSCSLDVGGMSFNNLRTVAESSITLLDNLTCADLILMNGNTFLGDYSIECSDLTVTCDAILSGDLTVNGNMSLTIGVGHLYADGKTVTIVGNLANGGVGAGFFGASTVVFDGTSAISGESTFYNLTINPGKTVTISSGTTQTITNSFTMLGNPSNRITLSSSTPSSTANLSKSSGVVNVSNVDVTDVNVSGGASWYAGSTCTLTNSTGWYERDPQTSVTFWPPVENFGEYLEVRFIVSDDENIEIHYTLDGSDPTFLSTLYTGPFIITGTTIKARAYDSTGIAIGDIYSRTYTSYPTHNPSGFKYEEFYLYSDKQWEMIPSGVSYYNLTLNPQIYNSPVVVTSSGYETTSSSEPWAQTSGYGKYTKVGYGHFTTLDSGAFDSSKNEYCLVPDASGKLLFNKILNENVFVEYEGSSDSYYLMTGIDYNPMRNESTGGFIHFSSVGEPTTLFLNASQDAIIADGYRGCTLTATLYDSNFDRVSSKNIVFEIYRLSLRGGLTPVSGVYSGVWSDLGYLVPNNGSVIEVDASGSAIKVLEETNARGEAYARYRTHRLKTGIMVIKAWYQDASGVNDITDFSQYWMSVGPFILDVSLLDTLDYLTNDGYTFGVQPLGV